MTKEETSIAIIFMFAERYIRQRLDQALQHEDHASERLWIHYNNLFIEYAKEHNIPRIF